MINAGDFRERITIESPPTAKGPIGGPKANEPWTSFATVSAQVKPLQGREAEKAKQIVAECTYQIRIRYLVGVNEMQRIDYGGRKFNILSAIDTEEMHEEWVLFCNEQK